MSNCKCRYCGNAYHWREAFSKSGHNDGDGYIQTLRIGYTLKKAGYRVSYFWWRPHNMIIMSIRKNDIEYMPINTSRHGIGYTNPLDYLPIEILELLEDQFPTTILFR